MINNLLDILSYENIYLIANWGVIPFWLLLIMLPNHGVTNFFAQSIIAPLLLAFAYGLVVFDIFLEGNIFDSFELYRGLEDLYSMFSSEAVVGRKPVVPQPSQPPPHIGLSMIAKVKTCVCIYQAACLKLVVHMKI